MLVSGVPVELWIALLHTKWTQISTEAVELLWIFTDIIYGGWILGFFYVFFFPQQNYIW